MSFPFQRLSASISHLQRLFGTGARTHGMHRLLRGLGAATLSLAVACGESTSPLPSADGGARLALSDGSNGGTPGVHFLTPIVANPGPFTGQFDPTRTPVVKVCLLEGGACKGADVATFSVLTGPPPARIAVDPAEEAYSAQWSIPSTYKAGSSYRIRVYGDAAGTELIASADLRMIAKSKDAKTVPAGFLGVLPGSRLPIRFRLEVPAGDAAPFVESTSPAANASDVSPTAAVSITFSEPVQAASTWIVIDCGTDGRRTVDHGEVTGGPTVWTFTPRTPLTPGAHCTVTVDQAYVTDVDVIDPPDNMEASKLFAFTVMTVNTDVAPTAAADGFTVTSGATLTGSVLNDNGNGTDGLGSPAATLLSFGGGSLGGTVTDQASGSSVSLAGGTLTVNSDGTFTLTAPTTLGSHTFRYRLSNSAGTSDATVSVQVNAVPVAPDAVDDAPAATSAPGGAWHTPLNTTLVVPAASGLLANDDLGTPAAAITAFGGGTMDTRVATVAGATATTGGVSLTVNTDGSMNFTPGTDYVGTFSFQYRLANSVGEDYATVTIAVGTRPVAVNETYTPMLVGNVPINTAASSNFSVLGNDAGDGRTATLVSATNGTAAIAPDGRFAFTPTLGYSGPASITYRVSNAFGDAPTTGVVSLTVGRAVWFVDASAAAGGDGRPATPYRCLAGTGCYTWFQSAPGDVIYLAAGSYAGAGGLQMQENQRVIGAGSSGTFASRAGLTWPLDAGTAPSTGLARPTISTTSGNALTVSPGNHVYGLIAGSAPGLAIAGTNGGALTVADVDIVNPVGRALQLVGSGSIAAQFNTISAIGGTGEGILIVGRSGSLTSAVTSIQNSSGTGIDVRNSGGFNFGTTSVSKSSAGIGVNLDANSGTTSFGSLVVSTASGIALQTNVAGTVQVNAGSLSATGAPALQSTGTTFAGAGFQSTTSAGSPNDGILVDSPSGTLSLGAGSVTGSLSRGVALIRGNGTISYAGTITTTAGASVLIALRTGGTVMLSGSISDAGTGVDVTANSGGDIRFYGDTKSFSTGANTAFSLTGNNGATVSVASPISMTIVTTTGSGLSATGGGTVTVTGPANEITTGGGTALRVENTNIGAAGLLFRSLSTTAAYQGLVLDNTGTAGGLTVTGIYGTAFSGGTFLNTGSTAIRLRMTRNTTLKRLQIIGSADWGIFGESVTDFSLDSAQVSGVHGDQGDDGAIRLLQLAGASSIRNSTISGGWSRNLAVVNSSGVLNRLTVDNTTFGAVSATGGQQNVYLYAGGGTMNTSVLRSFFTAARYQHFMQATNLSATADLVFEGNQVSNSVTPLAGGVHLLTSGTSVTTYRISNNTLRGINDFAALSVGGTAAMSGNISANDIGADGVAGSGGGNGIHAWYSGNSSHRTSITGNTIRQYTFQGIALQVGDPNAPGSGALQATVAFNSVGAPSRSGAVGVWLLSGRHANDAYTVCLALGGGGTLANTLNQSGSTLDVLLQQTAFTTVRLPGYVGFNTDNTAVQSFVQQNNGTTPRVFAANTAANGGGGFVGGPVCDTP